MELLGLRILIIGLLIVACDNGSNNLSKYIKYEIGDTIPLDTMHIEVYGSSYQFNGEKFSILFDESKIRYSSDNCNSEAQLTLDIGESVDWNCKSFYPFIGGKMTLLDQRVYTIGNTNYKVYKISNETNSFLTDSGIYFVENVGIVFIRLNGNRYFELKGDYQELIKVIKADLNFSELWPIPPVPPVPIFDDSEKL